MGELIFDKFKKYIITFIIFILTIQTTFTGGLFKLDKVHAASANITQINFTSQTQIININTVSQVMIAQTQNSSGIAETVSANTVFIATSDSFTGEFSVNGVNDWSSSKELTINSGDTNINFYYRNSVIGDHTITLTAADNDTDWTSATQNINVVNDIISPTTASVTNPVDESYYNASTIPAVFSGKSADDTIGNGLKANSTVFYIERCSDDKYWNGSSWISNQNLAWLATTHLAADNNSEVTWISNSNLPAWSEGETYYTGAKAIDKLGNSFTGTEITFYYDNTAPTDGSIKINNKEGVTNNRDITLTLSATGATKMTIWGDITNPENNIAFVSPKPETLTEGNGLKTVYVKFKDNAGNESATYQAKIYYNTNSDEPEKTTLDAPAYPYTGEFTATNSEEIKIEATITDSTFMTVSHYSTNPTGDLPSGITTLKKYYDFSMPDSSKINLPIKIKIYYTNTDLINAGISDENKLTGIYYWDFNANSWKLFSSTGVNTADTGIYAGYIWADVSDFSLISLTPITGGADLSAPGKPVNLKATYGNGEVTLNWDKNDDAVGYYVRYRKATTNDSDAYTTIYLSGRDTTSTKITGLTNDTEYEFGVAAKDSMGNISEYSTVKETPKYSSGTTTQTETTLKSYWIGRAMAADSTQNSDQEQNKENISTDNSNDQGEVESDEDNSEEPNWSRFFITFGIILLAAGAGLGGYYGYQWWMAGDEKEEKPIKKDKKNKQDNRW